MHEAEIKGGRCSKLAARFGQNPVFRAWYDLRRNQPVGTATEGDIKAFFYRACKVSTRAMIDHDAYALAMFHKIRNEFLADQRDANQFQKDQSAPWRCQAYTRWVKTLPCVVTGLPADDPHHLIGHGYGSVGGKVSDLWTFPLNRSAHSTLHDMGYKSWEAKHGSQWWYVAKTMERAAKEGVLVFEG